MNTLPQPKTPCQVPVCNGGFFWSDVTVQEFVIKSKGVVVKRFMGKVFIPKPITLSEMNLMSETFGGIKVSNEAARKRLLGRRFTK